MKKSTIVSLGVLGAAGALGALAWSRRKVLWYLKQNLLREKTLHIHALPWENAGQVYESIPYGDLPSQTLDLYLPDSEEALPLLVLLHGGGFIAGHSHSRQPVFMLRYFRDRGWACASINYRLAQEAPFPGGIEDCCAAVRFLYDHAADYRIDPSRIVLWGESAGAYFAAMAAVCPDVPPVRALVSHYGVMDFVTHLQDLRDQGVPDYMLRIANRWMEKECEGYAGVGDYWMRKNMDEWTDEERERSSVIAQVAQAPAEHLPRNTWMVHGLADITVSPTQSRRLKEALTARLGEDAVTLRIFPDLGHADDRFYAPDVLAEIETFLEKTVNTEREYA